MTIKPLINQKSNEKKESSHGHQEATAVSSNVRANHRNVLGNKSTVEGQSPQRRSEVFEDLTRHRRSPHKSSSSVRSKRDHVKREKGGQRSGSPQYHSSSVVLHSPHASASGVSSKSPKHGGLLTGTGTAPLQPSNSLLNPEETFSGYNSGDEHLVPKETLLTPDEWKNRDEQFTKALSERGFVIQDIVEDGACLFRAISLQIYGDQEMHEVIRQQAMDYIYQNREYFAHFVTEDITSYVKRKRNKESHGNHIEIQAMSEIYNRPVELYCYQTTPTNIFNSEQINNGYDPLRLSYQRGSHYNAIIDPYNASVGVGLGLAGYKPESQTHEAIRLSEQLEIEKTMFEDKLKTTDWDATNEAIEEQIARESYLQWCRDNIPGSDSSKTTTTTTSTTSSTSSSSTSSCSSSGLAASNSTATVTSAANLDSSCTPSNSKDHQSSDTNSKSGDQQQVLSVENDVSASECYESDSTDLSGSASSSTSSLSRRRKKSTKFGNSSSSSCPTRRLKRRHHKDPKKCVPADTSAIDGSHKRVKQLKKTPINADFNVKHNQQHPPETFNDYGSLPCTSKQAITQIDQPLSSFYQSLLESSYADDGIGQLSENEMVMKALRMSRIDFFESASCQHDEDANVYSRDENGNNAGGGCGGDSQQVQTSTVSDNNSKNFTSIRNYQADDDSDVPSP